MNNQDLKILSLSETFENKALITIGRVINIWSKNKGRVRSKEDLLMGKKAQDRSLPYTN
jgi:hypothetical protein